MLFSRPTREQAIALAGIFQCCGLVDELAKSGTADNEALETCLESLFIESSNACDVFPVGRTLAKGVETMQQLFVAEKRAANANILRYGVGVLQLAHKLRRSSAVLQQIGEQLQQTQRMHEHFSVSHENVITNLAQIYQDNISTFSYRIQVNGYAANLEQKLVAAKIRCLLFAGVRCAILWHRNGGRRHHLILYRRQVLSLLKQLSA